MKTNIQFKLAQSVLIILTLFSVISGLNISDQHVSREELTTRVNAFNQWYTSLNPSSKLEARVNENGLVRAYALEEIKVI